MKYMQPDQLVEHIKASGKKYAVGVAEIDGVPRAVIIMADGTVFGMDKEMLEEILPLLTKSLVHLKGH